MNCRMQNNKQKQTVKAAPSFQRRTINPDSTTIKQEKIKKNSTLKSLDPSEEEKNRINDKTLELLSKLFIIQGEDYEALKRKNHKLEDFLLNQFNEIKDFLNIKEKTPAPPLDKNAVDILA